MQELQDNKLLIERAKWISQFRPLERFNTILQIQNTSSFFGHLSDVFNGRKRRENRYLSVIKCLYEPELDLFALLIRTYTVIQHTPNSFAQIQHFLSYESRHDTQITENSFEISNDSVCSPTYRTPSPFSQLSTDSRR
ncbi:hypothetical protein E1B28_005208 [Marasmius oreades]|uniref:Uncharacterized protein n=1 Tax=Marasmius oreades TaxID=181124 RepID=A0A9P7V0D5_9AGAR|nr:uncharacterized protein E1B28_005208 [Marasmius oreades]KAG7097895.1 hypothetical protein E1B28_005208 [Marasmius oreades]